MAHLQRTQHYLRSPIGILAGVIIGTVLGIFFPDLGQKLGPFGQAFIDFMKMSVLPIILTSITISVSHFLKLQLGRKVLRILIVFVLIVLMCSGVGVITSLVTKPGEQINPTASPTLKEVVIKASSSTLDLNEPIKEKMKAGIVSFLLNGIPSNIFSAMSQNETFKIIIFALIFGVATGIFAKPGGALLELLDTTYHIFIQIFQAVLLFLPLAVIFLMARGISQIGPETIIGMTSFVGFVYVAFGILFVISTLLMMLKMKAGPFRTLNVLKYPIFIAFSTQSTIASIPAAIQSMRDFKVPKELGDMLVPLGTVMGRYGNIMYFAFTSLFIFQLYHIDLTIESLIFITIMSVFAGIATSGQTGPVTLAMLAIILGPLGIPTDAVLVLLIAIDPLIDPGRTTTSVYTNCAVVALAGYNSSDHEPEPVEVTTTA